MLTCTNCGQQNQDGFRFCGSCGAELAAVPAREVRKTVTVLFADVTGSTALGERLDPESLRRVMSRYFERMRRVVEHHGGTVEKFIGDAIMAVFGIPRLHEDDATRALRAASEMGGELASLNEQLDQDFGVRLEMRIGVNTGQVVTGDADSSELLATGDAVNVAARLEQAASPGEILLGEETRELARNAIEVAALEPLSLKGKGQPLVAYRLVQMVETAAFDPRFDAAFVGRRLELAQIRAAFDETVAKRHCRLVTVLGPPGIGKSRLGRELATALADEATVLFGRCLPYGEGITYWPLQEIFAAAGAEEDLATALAAIAPEAIFWTVRKALARQARQRPLVLILEDIHWAEPTLLDLLEHLAEWTRDAPLFLFCLARPELLDRREAWSGGRSRAEILPLQPLSQGESDDLIDKLPGGSQLESDARNRIREMAEGNPLFVEQLLAMLAEGKALEQVPLTIHALIGARLDSLTEEERDLVERASVIGLEFEWAALGELAADRRRPSGEHLASLVRKDLIRPHEVIEDTFRFHHMLIRDAAYERIPKELRSDLHERFAGWLDGRDEEFDEITGYHLEQAYRSLAELGPPNSRAQALGERAADLLADSGQRALARGDMRAATNLLERAGALFPLDDRRRLNLLPSLGRALIEAGRMDHADSVLSEAAERGRAAGERRLAVDATLRLTLLRLHRTDVTKGQAEAWRALGAAIPVFEELGDEAGLAHAFTVAGALRYWHGQAAAAIEDLERAAVYARRVGDQPQEAETLNFMLWATLLGPMPCDQALERVHELHSRARARPTLEVHVLSTQAMLEGMQSRFDAGRDLIRQAKELTTELGLELGLTTVSLRAAQVELLAGDGSAAEGQLRYSCEALERMGDWGHLSSHAPRLADALLMQGRHEEAMELTEKWPADRLTVPEDVDGRVTWRRVHAKLLAHRGDIEEAERVAREATELAERTDYLWLRGQALADLAEVLRLAARPKESAAALEDAIRVLEEKGNVAAATTARGRLAELQINR